MREEGIVGRGLNIGHKTGAVVYFRTEYATGATRLVVGLAHHATFGTT